MTTETSDPQLATPPTHPFTRDDADIVLRSSDGVDFHVHRMVLILASPTLQSLFTVPQPTYTTPDSSEMTKDGKPIVDMHGEDAQTLEAVLREWYPSMESIAYQDLSIVVKVLVMSSKFDMKGIAERMESVLQKKSFLTKDPLRVYAIASRFGLRQAAEAAAKESLLHPAIPAKCPEDYETMSAADHHKLLAYRARCTRVLDDILIGWKWYTSSSSWPFENIYKSTWCTCTGPGSYGAVEKGYHRLTGNYNSLIMRLRGNMSSPCAHWFLEHIERVRVAFAHVVTGSTVTAPDNIQQTFTTIREAGLNCECARAGPQDLLMFSNELAKQVDKALSLVKFVF
ncbi:hypothetical protein EIP86_009967 [Pleurotus ostreatoroseus]|nr:hypothetical protein EIP86_009967 [Pleurotus ostreatoroseus]